MSNLLEEEYEIMKDLYDMADATGVQLSKPSETVLTPEPGYVAVYESQLKNGLRFLVFNLLREVINHYGVSIAQVYPIGICRLIVFEMACRWVKVRSTLTLFRQFYQMKGIGGIFYFSSRSKGKDFLRASADLINS